VSIPRQVLPGVTILLTRRCAQREFLLRPSPLINQILGFSLANAANRFHIDIHAFAFMSNHIHIIATDMDGRVPQFMHWFCEFSAKCINRLHNRKESVWAPGSYNAVRLAGQEDVIAAMGYVIANPVRAGLVRTPRKWPGLVSLPNVIGGEPLEFRRPEIFFRKKGKVPAGQSLQLVRPPAFEGQSDAGFIELLVQEVRLREKQVRDQFKQERRKFIGRRQVLKMSPFTRALSEEAGKRIVPRIACKNKSMRIELLHKLKAFLKEYRLARARYRRGDRSVCFPEGTYWMRVQFGVTCMNLT